MRSRLPQHALFMLDLNGFKRVNDRYGHAVGDHVLQVVVERFRRVARPSDLLARLGGDEFAVLSYDVDKLGAQAIGKRFAAVLKNDIAADGHLHGIGVSIGAALFPERRHDQGHDPAQRRPRHVPRQGRGQRLGRASTTR